MRKQRPRGTTTLEAVVNAALVIADGTGVSGVKIRAVAELVSAPPMSLYTHFANKSELLDLMYIEVSRRMYVDSNRDTWQAELSALCHNIGRVLSEHPRWAELIGRPIPRLVVPVRERVLAMMVADGFAPEVAFAALASAVLTAIGLILAQIATRDAGASSLETRFQNLKRLVASTPGGEHPVTSSAVAKIGHFDFDHTFNFAIDAMILGLQQLREENAR